MSEASLEVNTRYRNDLEEEKGRLLKDMDRFKGKVTAADSDTLWQHIVTTSGGHEASTLLKLESSLSVKNSWSVYSPN